MQLHGLYTDEKTLQNVDFAAIADKRNENFVEDSKSFDR